MLFAILCLVASADSGDAEREAKLKIPQIVEAAEIRGGSRVADVGAGDGFLTSRLARAAGREGRVWAMDVDRITAIPALRKRVRKEKLKQVEVVVARADQPSMPAANLDAVVMVISYHEIAPHARMLAAVRDALRAGGRLVIVDFMPCRTRDQPRETQAEAHALAPGFVEEELREAGFEIASRDDGFIANPDEELARWMIVARKPTTPN